VCVFSYSQCLMPNANAISAMWTNIELSYFFVLRLFFSQCMPMTLHCYSLTSPLLCCYLLFFTLALHHRTGTGQLSSTDHACGGIGSLQLLLDCSRILFSQLFTWLSWCLSFGAPFVCRKGQNGGLPPPPATEVFLVN
jgi:hypothetical protein